MNLAVFAAAVAIQLVMASTIAANADDLPETCYLFSSFRGNGEDGLHLAWSRDGLKWTALNGDRSFLRPEVGKEKLMRDPCIAQGPDGTFHMVWTDSWTDRTIGYASSKDLIHWSKQRAIPVMAHEPTARNCWAPEIIYDERQQHFLIFWSTTIPGRFPETAKTAENDYNHRIYCTTTADFKRFTPTKLFYDPGFNVIDATILRDGGRFHLFVKDETLKPTVKKHLRVASSDQLEGPYGELSEPFTESWMEGPSAIRIGGDYVVYYDSYRKHEYRAMRSKDLVTWEDISKGVSFPKGTRHGTVLAVHRDVIGRLLEIDGKERAALFPLDRVRLLDGPFKDAQEVDRKHLLAHDVDRLLAPFRVEAGLNERAPKYGNWESQGLDGHSAGHYLSAIAMMHAATGDAELKRRVDYMVTELAECQRANGNGYVGGIVKSKELWADIAAGKMKVTGFGLNDRWVPWYNLHKTFQGLGDAYRVGHNEQAKQVLIGLADWCGALLGKLSDEQVQQMLRAEHGGMNEVLADVSAITGDKKYLELARRFSDRAILDPLAAGRDELTGKHANTQIPKVVGFRRIASLDGDERLRRAADFFWDNVTSKRSVAIGGNSVGEHFHPPDNFSRMLDDRTGPETCNTYNMLRLTEGLFADDPQTRYADYYERALYNHILASQHPRRGGFVYFTPMRPRHYRVYSQAEQAFWCCVGTGFENHAKYGQFIYARGGGGDDELLVNLFIASELRWDERGVTLRQETRFPDEPSTRIVVTVREPTTFTLRLRHPHWIPTAQFAVRVNGEEFLADTESSSFGKINRQWKSGDVVDVQLPMRVVAERLPDGSDYVAFRYGPLVLAAASETQDMPGLFAGEGRGDHVAPGPLLPLHDAPMLVTDTEIAQLADRVRPVAGEPLTFSVPDVVRPERWRDLKLIPFFRLHEARYVLYWRVIAPEQYASERKRVEAEERERLALDAATIDRVIPGQQQPEVEHNYRGERSGSGTFRDRSWRDANGGWFSYDIKAPRDTPAELLVTYWGGDRGRRFDLLVDGEKVADVHLDGQKPDEFFSVRYPLPAERGRDAVTVKFAAHENSIAGGVFDVRVVRRQP